MKISFVNFSVKQLKYSVFFGLVSLSLTGCLVDNMEKITEETRDQVKESNQAIRETEDLQKLAKVHVTMLDPRFTKSARVNAAKAVIAKYPENMLASDLGMLLPTFRVGSFKKMIAGSEIELVNVPYVGNQLSDVIGVAGLDPELFNVVAFAAAQMVMELETKTKMPGITAEQMGGYRDIAKRVVVIAPAILSAVSIKPMEDAMKSLISDLTSGKIQPSGFGDQLQNTARGATRLVGAQTRGAVLPALEQLAVNVSLEESAVAEMRALISVRMGIN